MAEGCDLWLDQRHLPRSFSYRQKRASNRNGKGTGEFKVSLGRGDVSGFNGSLKKKGNTKRAECDLSHLAPHISLDIFSAWDVLPSSPTAAPKIAAEATKALLRAPPSSRGAPSQRLSQL